jgi:hypothetical protein
MSEPVAFVQPSISISHKSVEEELKRREQRIKFLQEQLKEQCDQKRQLEEMKNKGISSISSPVCSKPYVVHKNVISEKDREEIRHFFNEKRETNDPNLLNSTDYDTAILNQRLVLPSLEDTLKKLYPDMMIFSTHYFSGSKEGGEYSSWHTGINLSKTFKGFPVIRTVWIPLQTLTSETGGRLWFYNGEYMPALLDMWKGTNKKTSFLQFFILSVMNEELENNKITEDVEFGDVWVFPETYPHKVDRDCKIQRDILSVRLIERSAILDEEFLKELLEFPEDGVINMIEKKEHINILSQFLNETATNFRQSKELENK